MKQKHYIDIETLKKPNYADGLNVGDKIILQEKIEGT